jgi:hypothetical protein
MTFASRAELSAYIAARRGKLLPAPSKEVAVKATPADYTKPKASTLYESNGYYYRTDANARLVEVSGNLRLKKAPRNMKKQTEVGHSSGVPGDEGGHMIGTQFDGLGEGPLHMAPQARNLNRGKGSQWTAMEREWANALGDGHAVSAKITLDWPPGSSRPSSFRVQYTITNGRTGIRQTTTKTFANK